MAARWTRTAGAIALGLAAPALAEQTPAPPTAPGYTLPSTQMWDMRSSSGEVYRIFVSYPAKEAPASSWPAAEMPENGWPVLYVLDGNASFASFAEARRVQERSEIGRSIVVGVGYPTDLAYDAQRLYDLTAGPTDSPAYARFAKLRSGGWDKFLDFLTGELRNEVGRRFRIDAERQALFGHSLGGLFAIHALYTKPGAFHAIIAASPSLFWHEQLMRKEERAFATRLETGAIPKVSRLLVVTGEREEAILERWDPEDFVKRIEPLSAHGLRVRSQTYQGEGHMTVPARAVTDTLRFAFSWP